LNLSIRFVCFLNLSAFSKYTVIVILGDALSCSEKVFGGNKNVGRTTPDKWRGEASRHAGVCPREQHLFFTFILNVCMLTTMIALEVLCYDSFLICVSHGKLILFFSCVFDDLKNIIISWVF